MLKVSLVMDHADEDERLYQGVLQYMENHPYAADTVDGITEWWLGLELDQSTIALVQTVVNRLVRERKISALTLPDGKKVYKRYEAKRE